MENKDRPSPMMKEGEQAQRRLWHRKNEYDVTIYCMDEPQKRTYVPSYMRLLTPVELTPKSYKSSEYGNPRLEMKKILENAQKINEMAKQNEQEQKQLGSSIIEVEAQNVGVNGDKNQRLCENQAKQSDLRNIKKPMNRTLSRLDTNIQDFGRNTNKKIGSFKFGVSESRS